MGKLGSVVSFGVRAGVVGGTVWAFNEVGAFGDVKQGEAANAKIKALKLEDLVGKDVADQVPAVEMPQEITSTLSTVSNTTSDFSKNFPAYWNCGVKTVITGIINLPETTNNYLSMAVEEVKKSMN